ncbi:MAG: hypothetical protein E7445_02130 [Ruminococcaceae bacterium]|nr:hypothetical protein [Oscillospiraceae bacterium]
MRKLKTESGMITIEATISLSAFMFAIVTVLTIVNICLVQSRMSCAINATAKEISQYSYLYSLTGLNDSQNKVYEAGQEGTKPLTQILTDVNTVYNEIENLGKTGKQTPENVKDILGAWDSVEGSLKNIGEAGSSLESTLSDIAKDPKNLMFGIAKMAANEGFDLVKSRLIAAPLAKVLVQKHLVSAQDGNVNAYLKFLGVVPSATGSYIDGLDFSQSMLFPNGSSEIRVIVEYDVKVIALLPIDFSFHFSQTAVTHGWLGGESSHQTSQTYTNEANNTLWTQATVKERSNMIRHMVIKDMLDEGYKKTSGLTDVQLYNTTTNEFVMIASMNPLWSSEDEPARTLADLDDVALTTNIERLCGKANSTTEGLSRVKTKTEVNGTATKAEHECAGAATKIILVIPEDDGLKEKIESIIANAKTNGVTIEVVPSYGRGARSTLVANGEEETGE